MEILLYDPYDETVILDADTIFPTDVKYWWETLEERDVWATTNIKTYRGETADPSSKYYREHFVKNNLSMFIQHFFILKSFETASELFKMIQLIFENWQRFYFKYMPNGKLNKLSADVVYALAIQLLGLESETTVDDLTEMPTLTHMKSFIQDLPGGSLLDERWTLSIPTYFSSVISNFKVGNFNSIILSIMLTRNG